MDEQKVIQGRLEAAIEEPSSVCKRDYRLTIHTPAQETDSDIVLGNALADSHYLLAEIERLSRENEQFSEALRSIMHTHRSTSIDTPLGEVVAMLQEMLKDVRATAFKALGMDKIYADLDNDEEALHPTDPSIEV